VIAALQKSPMAMLPSQRLNTLNTSLD
jgi:hypothetical protein